MEFSYARELLGYIPWFYNIPPDNYSIAWKQLFDSKGFEAAYGPTTVEQRCPDFKISYEGHECQWNGPSWPYLTSMTLAAMANYSIVMILPSSLKRLFKSFEHIQ